MTTETKHTPGPWQWYDGLGPHSELTTQDAMEHGGDSVCYHGSDWPMTEANKRLIAAAPELLEALEKLRQEVIVKLGQLNVRKDYSLMVCLEGAKVAIQKATK